jgi:hypothetical protein
LVFSCGLLLPSSAHQGLVHARRSPWGAPPLGPPSERGQPTPASLPVAARAWLRAARYLIGIAVTSSSTTWTSMRLLLAARWVLRRVVRMGSFIGIFVFVLIIPAARAHAAPTRWTWLPVIFPLRIWRHMGWASLVTRAGTRPAGSGLATMSTGAGPLISASMANFIAVFVPSATIGPPPIACERRSILTGLLVPMPFHMALHFTPRLHARGGSACTCIMAPAWDSSQIGAGGRRVMRRPYEETQEEEVCRRAAMLEMDAGMMFVFVMVAWTTNSIPGAIQEQEYEGVIVGVVGFLLASGYATTSTISSARRGRCGSAVAVLLVAAGSATTPFPPLDPSTSLAAAPTARPHGDVPGVAQALLLTLLRRQTPGTSARRPLKKGATAWTSAGGGTWRMAGARGDAEMGCGGWT